MVNPAKRAKPTVRGLRRSEESRLIDVTVVLLERALPSTSVAPIEIFSCAGVMWSMLRGEAPAPRFRVRTVSLDGRSTR